jgi:integrase
MASEKAGSGKRPLTTSQIDSLTSGGKPQAFRWDSKLSGFGVRVTSAGAKSFILQTRITGKPARLTIGSCGVWTIDEARKHARGLLVQIDQGTDPREIKATDKPLEAVGDRALMDWWPQYLETGKPSKKQAFKPNYAMHLRLAAAPGGDVKKVGRGLTVRGPLFNILQTKLKNLDVYVVRDWFNSELSVRPGQAVKSLRMLQGFCRWLKGRNAELKAAVDLSIFTEHEIQTLIPARNKRVDRIAADKVDAWLDAAMALPDRVVGVYLIGLLLTGCRRMELATLKWVNINGGLMTINDKVNETRIVPVGSVLSGLLGSLPRLNEYVFPSPNMKRSTTGHLGDPRISAGHVAQAAGVEVTLHGLRRSFALLSEKAGIPTGAAAQLMGHSTRSIIDDYRPRTPDDLIEYSNKVQEFIFKRGTK